MRQRYLFLFYLKQIGRNKLYIGASIIFLVLLFSRLLLFFTSPYDIEDYGQLPSEIAMIVQIVTLFYIVFFYRLQSNEQLYGVQSFFINGYRIGLEKIGSMFYVHVIYQGVMLVMTYGIFALIYLVVGIEPSSLFLSLFRFLIVYMFAPLALSMLFGVIVAMTFEKKKISFFAILFLWISSGSVNTELFRDYFSTVHANDWQSIFFIGMNNIMRAYEPYVGFDVHWGNELKLITWFLVSVAVIFLLSLRWTYKKSERKLVIGVLFTTILLSVFTSYGMVKVSTKSFSYADYVAETDYYMNVITTDTDLRYQIESYKISLEGKLVTAQVGISHLNTITPTFQLYHAYPVKWIKADGKIVDFERHGDIVTVHLPESTSLLTFHYQIIDTYYVPFTNGRIVLLADMAWYPKKRVGQIYEMDINLGWIKPTEQFLTEETYSFTLESDNVLYSNLPRHREIYSGKSQGLTLIKGQGNQLTYGDYEITYPADWPKMKERTRPVLTQLETTIDEIQQLVPTAIQSLPASILFSNNGLSTFITRDHLVYNVGGYKKAIDAPDVTRDFQESLLQSIVQRHGPYHLHMEWINIASQFIREKNGWAVESKDRTIDSHSDSNREQESIDLVYQFFNQLSAEQQQDFLQKWYKEMDETWGWDHVLALIKEWR